MACLFREDYWQCQPAPEVGEGPCGAHNQWSSCAFGVWCTSVNRICESSAKVGETCWGHPAWDVRNICGMAGFCDIEINTCRPYITSSTPREDPCSFDWNHGWKDCKRNKWCTLVFDDEKPHYGLCVPRFGLGDDCWIYEQACQEGLTCNWNAPRSIQL